MQNDEIINKWKEFFQEDKKTLKKISKLKITSEDNPFFSRLFFDSRKIIAKLGIGYGKLNKLTIYSIAYAFSKTLEKYNKTKQNEILICSDGSLEVKDFLLDIANVFAAENFETFAFKSLQGYDIKFFRRTINKLEIKAGIFIEKSIYNDDVFNIFFVNSNGDYFDYNFLSEIQNEILNIDVFKIKPKFSRINFLSNNKVINDYIQKILHLSSRKGDQKKTKICISNYNSGLTEILKKIFGNMDFNYVINNNINKKNINKRKKRDSKTIINFYWRDILFAKKNKSDMLICFSKNGSQMEIFIIKSNKTIHLDANEITLMFLNFFLIELNLNSVKLRNTYIGTDIKPIQSIKNLINKYNLELQVSEDIEKINEKFLLFFWNQNSQFVFGENKFIEFGPHHLIVKFLEMINYYKTQRLSIYSQRNILIKMFGSYKTYTMVFNFDLNSLYFFLDNINNTKFDFNYHTENIFRFKEPTNLGENLIARILLKNNIEIFIKFNYLNRKIIFFIRLEEYNNYHIIKNKYLNINKKFVKKMENIIKKDLKKSL